MMGRKKIEPPNFASLFFKWYCRNELQESILGDMHERFHHDVLTKGVLRAKLGYWLTIIRFINRHTLRRSKEPRYNSNFSAMFRNYFIITLRSLWKNRAYSAINIFGLAIGLASCLIIFFFVRQELSFDKFHSRSDQLYRVTNILERSTGTTYWGRTPPVLAQAIRDNFPSVERATRLRYTDDLLYTVGDRSFYQGNAFYADSLFLEMFDFALKSGDANTALDQPGSIVLTEAMATKFFGDEDPMGKLITLENERSLRVTGVFEPIPHNSHLTFDLLISFSTYVVPEGYLSNLNSWGWAGFWTYVQLKENTSYKVVEEQVSSLYKENFKSRPDLNVSVAFQPLKDIYLESSHYSNVGESVQIGNKSTIGALSIIAVLILLVAGFNFMNLSTAISLSRSKEIGVRKIMGAVRGRIMIQFLMESVMVCLISLAFAVSLVFLSEPYFSRSLGIRLPNSLNEYTLLLPLFLLATIFIGLMAGTYPSMVLSAFSPIRALKGKFSNSGSTQWIRKVLMVLQFSISLGLISASLIIAAQMDFMKNKPLGFESENLLKIRVGSDEMIAYYEELKNKFMQNADVLGVATTSHTFDGSSSSSPAWLKGADEEDAHQLAYYQTDANFQAVTGLNLVEGRYFSHNFPSDSTSAIILNQAAVAEFGLQEPLNQKINFTNRERTVIGVVEDFHFTSLHSVIGPMALIMPFTNQDLMVVRIGTADLKRTLSTLEDDWRSIVGALPFEVTFLDDGIQAMYEREEKLSSLIVVFSTLAVLLACLGLYGLVAYSVNYKLKEVGIRKVLGASLEKLLLLLSKEFIILILMANLISWPVTWYFVEEWLSRFAYRIDVGVESFFIAAALLLVIAIFTISQQTVRAALINPVEVLRNE